MVTYRPDIDALRAFAVLIVIIFHAYPEVLPSGFIGVDVFFVISGYLVTSIILQPMASGTFSIVTFYVRRIRRIFPALIVVTSSSLVLGWFELLPPELKSLGRHVSAAALFLSNFLLGTETGYFAAPANSKPLLHLWSLSIEEQFYLIWPILLLVFMTLRIGASWLVAAAAAASFTHGIFLLDSGSIWAFYDPTARFWELMLGAAVATRLVRSRPVGDHDKTTHADYRASPPRQDSAPRSHSPVINDLLSLLGAALLLAATVCIRRDSAFPGYVALCPTLGTASLLAAGSQALVNRTLARFPLLVGIGLISYPLYLWHWPLLSIYNISHFDETSPAMRGLIIGASFLLAWLTYRFVEKPIRGGGFGRIKALVLILLLGTVGFCGEYTFRDEGLRYQRSARVRSFYFFVLERGQAWRSEVCFLEEFEGDKLPDFEQCTDRSPIESAPRVFLWGDSHAASLYPALRDIASDAITLTQVTTALCNPLIDILEITPRCKQRNEATLERILREKPNVVILAGNWKGNVLPALSSMLQQLKAGGIGTVILVGQTPVWRKPAPHVIAATIQADPFGKTPQRYTSAVKPDDQVIKAQLQKAASSHGAVFVSPFDALCNEQGCLALTGDTPDTIVTGDFTHLTKWGASIVISKFPRFWCDGKTRRAPGTTSQNDYCGGEGSPPP